MNNNPHTNTLSGRQALLAALDFADASYSDDNAEAHATRAFFIIQWLREMDLQPEAQTIEERVRSTAHLKNVFARLVESYPGDTQRLSDEAGLLSYIFNGELASDEWRATQGTPLVDELWEIITQVPAANQNHK